MEHLLNVSAVGALLACSADHVYKLHAAGKLPGVNLGTGRRRATLRFRPEDVRAFVDGRLEQPALKVLAPVATRVSLVGVERRIKTRTGRS